MQMTLEPDLHEELKAYVAVVPGASVSGLVNDVLMPLIPDLRAVRTAIEDGDEIALREALERMIGASILRAQYTTKRESDEKESESK